MPRREAPGTPGQRFPTRNRTAQAVPFFFIFPSQDGYAAFSVSESHLEQVRRYIACYKQHHKRMSFQDELLQLLNKHRVQYDERYLWD